MFNDDQQIRNILVGYTTPQESWEVIDPDNWDPEQGGSTHGSSGVSYYYMECAVGRSCWQLKRKETVDECGTNPVMYKYKFERGNGSRKWVMTLYTLHPFEPGENMKAICAIQKR